MRFIIVTAVDQGTETRDHLNHRSIESLPERTGCKFRLTDIVLIINERSRSRLSCQINIRLEPETE